jgi:hypothetical protein
MGEHMPVDWPDEVDEILGGDLTVGIGMPTGRQGVSLATVTTLGLRDREAGTVTFTTSLGFGRKLERIADDPRIAVAYHTRQHGQTDRPGYVLVQGQASVAAATEADREEIGGRAERFMGQTATGWFWDRWLRVYYYDRVLVNVAVERLLWWPDGDTAKDPEVLGAPLPERTVPSQDPPREATVARVSVDKTLKSANKLPHQLVGVVLADGRPLVLPTQCAGRSGDALRLDVPSPLLPRGRRRAGFMAHDFHPGLVGLSNATHTGWLDADGNRQVRWTPHTRHAFTAPPNKTLLLLANGLMARRGYRQAIKQGRDKVLAHAQDTIRS